MVDTEHHTPRGAHGYTDVPVAVGSSGDTSLSSMSAVSSPLTSQEVDNEGGFSASAHEALLQDFDVASIGSATSGHSHAALQNIRQQMALSLERMRDLEEQVKLIPILQVQLSVAKEEKRKISLVMQASKLEQSKRSENEVGILDLMQSSSPRDTSSAREIFTTQNIEEAKTLKTAHVHLKNACTNTDPSTTKQISQLPNGERQNPTPIAPWLELRQVNFQIPTINKTASELRNTSTNFIITPTKESKTEKTFGREEENSVKSSNSPCTHSLFHKTTATFHPDGQRDQCHLSKLDTSTGIVNQNGSLPRASRSLHRTSSPRRRSRSVSADRTVELVKECASNLHFLDKIPVQSSTRRQKPMRNVETQTVSKFPTRDVGTVTCKAENSLQTVNKLKTRDVCIGTYVTDKLKTKDVCIGTCEAEKFVQKTVSKLKTRDVCIGTCEAEHFLHKTVSKLKTRDIGIGTLDAENSLQTLASPLTIPSKEVENTQDSKSKSKNIDACDVAKKAFLMYIKHTHSNDLSTKDERFHIDFFMKQMNAVSGNRRSEEQVAKKSAGTQVSIQAKSVGLQISPNVVLKSEAIVQVGPKVRHVGVSAVVEQKCVSSGEYDIKDPVCPACNSKTAEMDNKRRNVNIAITTPRGNRVNPPHTVSIHVQTVKQKDPPNNEEFNTQSPEKNKAKFMTSDEKDLTGNVSQEKYKIDCRLSDSITKTQDMDSSIPRPKNQKIFSRQNTYTKIDHLPEVSSKEVLAADVPGKNLSSSPDLSDHCLKELARSPSGGSALVSVAQINGSQLKNTTSVASKDENYLVSGAPIARTSKTTPAKPGTLTERIIPSTDPTIDHTTSTPDVIVKKQTAFPSLQSPLSSEKISPVQDRNIKDLTNLKLKSISPVQKSKLDALQPSSPLIPTVPNTGVASGISTETVVRSSRFEPNSPSSIPIPIPNREPVKPTALVNPSCTGIDSGISNLSFKDLGGSCTSSPNVEDRPSTSKSASTNFSRLEEGNGEFSSLHPAREDILNLSSAERPARVEPSRTMKAALKVVNDALLKSTSSNTSLSGARDLATTSTNNALDIIRREWFMISSTREADPNTVEDFLDYFEELSSELLKHVVNLTDKAGNTAMHYALSTGNFDVVSILLDSKVCDINLPNSAGYTAVMLLSLAKIRSETDRRVLQRFLGYADVNIRAALNGQTALMLAVSQNRLDMVQLLVEGGADLNIQDIDGSTALMCAAEHGLVSMVQYLISQPDADQTIKDLDGSTALDIALDAGHKDVGILLYAHKHFSRNSSPYSSLRGRRSKSATPKPGASASGSTPPPRTTPNSPLPNRARRTQQ